MRLAPLPPAWRPARPADWPRLRQLLARREAAWLSLIDRLEAAAPWWHRHLWLLEPVPGAPAPKACFYLNESGLAFLAADPDNDADLFLEALVRVCRRPLARLYCLIGLESQIRRLQSIISRPTLADTVYALMAKPGPAAPLPARGAGEGRGVRPGTWPSRTGSGFLWRGLDIRRATEADTESLLELQCLYEVEEVLVPGHAQNRQLSRSLLAASLREQCLFCASDGRQLVAKAGTNGRAWNLVQIGGVFTLPGWRNRGIGEHLMGALLAEIAGQGFGASLFVKRRNAAALRLYDKLGFDTIGDLVIAYY
jgi:ribosomal protein S18 acetylase RimI-like enzyme